jgi:hypothetical protein
MALDALLFVSKRLQAVVAALICLGLAQLVAAVPDHEPPPVAVRVAISR